MAGVYAYLTRDDSPAVENKGLWLTEPERESPALELSLIDLQDRHSDRLHITRIDGQCKTTNDIRRTSRKKYGVVAQRHGPALTRRRPVSQCRLVD